MRASAPPKLAMPSIMEIDAFSKSAAAPDVCAAIDMIPLSFKIAVRQQHIAAAHVNLLVRALAPTSRAFAVANRSANDGKSSAGTVITSQ